MKHEQKSLTLKTLNKSNVWDAQENDIFRMFEAADKDAELKENIRHYIDIVKTAFEMEEIVLESKTVEAKYEERDFKVGVIRMEGGRKAKWAVKKRPIKRVTDLTYENIRHISAVKLIEVLERNFGGGWDSLSQSIQDIIQSGFDISTTTLPANRLHKEGGMYEKKVNDGYEVLEIAKGSWVEAIFAKAKPEIEKPRYKEEDALEDADSTHDFMDMGDDRDADDDLLERCDYDDDDDDDDTFDDDKLTEESYRTTFDADPEDLNLEAEDVSEDEY